jgi:hypothetical protein
MKESDFDETRVRGRLPHLDIGIMHRRSRDGESEQLSISLQAVPSFAAFGRFLEATNPFQFWARLAQVAWLPWLAAFNSLTPRHDSCHLATPAASAEMTEPPARRSAARSERD